MPQLISKTDVIKKLQTERRRLEQNLARLTAEDMLCPGVVGEWSVKDILAHLADWEEHMILWMQKAREQDPFPEIEEGMRWDQFTAFGQIVYALNQRICARHKGQPLEDVLAYFHGTHRQLMEMVEAMPEDELTSRGRYQFLGGGAIIDWLNAYAAHDRWAKTHIRKWMKKQKE